MSLLIFITKTANFCTQMLACSALVLTAACCCLEQDEEKHRRLKTIMSDRPDLINSELGGMAVAGTDQCFKQAYLKRMFADMIPLNVDYSHPFYVSVDPAAGGEKSDFAVISFWIHRGVYQASFYCFLHAYLARKV